MSDDLKTLGKKLHEAIDDLDAECKQAKEPVKCVELRPDWKGKCFVCHQSPIVPLTDMCGPCTFGEADTINGQWWDDKDHECDGSCKEKP